MTEKQITRKSSEYMNFKKLDIKIPHLPDARIPVQIPDIRILPKTNDYAWINAKEILTSIAKRLEQGTGTTLRIDTPAVNIDADLSIPCHPLARPLRKSPIIIAQEAAIEVSLVALPPVVKRVFALNGYVNFEFDMNIYGNTVLQEIERLGNRYGEQNLGNGATVVLDVSSPNVAKHMSVGHLRSTVIGESLSRLYKKAGYKVIRDNHLGDWGTQFGMLGRAYDLWKDEVPELKTNPVQGLYKLYVKMHQEIVIQKEANKQLLIQGGMNQTEAEARAESELEKEGKKWFQRLEQGDSEAKKLWKWAYELSLKEFERVYQYLGPKFEYMLGESYYINMNPYVAQALLTTKTAEKADDSSIAVFFQDKELGAEEGKPGKLVIRKSDGTSLYSTRDLSTLVARTHWFQPEKIIYVVGGEQQLYFKQVFNAFERFSQGKGPALEHVWFGKVSLPEGQKMSTRKGNVIFLEDVLNEAIKRARAKIEVNKIGINLTPDEREKIARQVGIGAVIYLDLGQGRERNIQFDWEKALSFEGNSAPYLQYTFARANSILKKAKDSGIDVHTQVEPVFGLEVEVALIRHLAKFPNAIEEAINQNQPSVISEFIYKTADLFNRLYGQTKILKEPDTTKRNSQLRLVSAVAQVIKNGLDLLAIEAPERM